MHRTLGGITAVERACQAWVAEQTARPSWATLRHLTGEKASDDSIHGPVGVDRQGPTMLTSIDHLKGSRIVATDGEIGHVDQAYFDDRAWVIRFLVVNTGSWLSGREVLISPYAVQQPLGTGKLIDVHLTRAQVEGSPGLDTHLPVSRRHELENLRYYAYPEYWEGDGLWGMGALPLMPLMPLPDRADQAPVPAEDVHLRSSASVTGYDIQASDGSIGHVQDFIFDDASWAVRYLVVDTRNWWPGGRKVLLATHWIDRIDWAESTAFVKLTREQVRDSPLYEEDLTIQRAYEQHLHDAYNRRGYWD
jgi:uncharacterized protein YrrD